MSGYNRCKECYNMKCIFATGEREDIDTDIDTSKCSDFRPMTNADSIRGMTDEELAVVCEDGCPPDKLCPGKVNINGGSIKEFCQKCWLDWLKAPVEVDG